MTKTKVLPIRLTEEFYNDLKTVAKAKNTSMAEILVDYEKADIITEAKDLQLSDAGIKKYSTKPQTTSEYLDQFIFTGKTYHNDKTYDEIAYGINLDE